MADYQLTQTGDEVQDILDNSQTGKYFYNQTVATWSSDATYSDYPYKGVITLTGVKGTDGVEVTFSNADATSGNYSPICNTVANGVEIWAKAQDNYLVIPTIHITTGADVQLSGDDAYLPISGGNITGSLSVVGNQVVTANELTPTTESVSTYITWASGITVNGANCYRIAPHLLFIDYDISGTISAGQTVIGTAHNFSGLAYGASRVSSGASTYPATTVAISGGQFRLHTTVSGTASAGTIILKV